MHLHAFIFQSSSNAFNQSIHILRLNIKASIPTCLLAVIPSTVRLRTHSPRIHSQAFSSSAFWQSKQGGKQDTKRNIAQAITTSEAAGNDPYDFTTLEENIANVTQRLRDELVKIRVGGRVGVESVGELRVSLKGPGGGSEAGPRVDKHKGRGKNGVGDKQGGRDETLRLEELAQVMQRGRTLILMVGEEEHIKPISSALLSSQYSLNPTASTHNPLELHIPIPPPTADSRKQTLEAAAKCGESAGHAIRQARGGQQKRIRAMQLAKTALPDDVKKAGEKMEKVVERANKEAKEIVEQAKKTLESR